MGTNDAVDWRAELGGGTAVALIQAGTFRSDAGTLLGPVPGSCGVISSRTRSTTSDACSRPSTAC